MAGCDGVKDDHRIPLAAVVGPTASGKTRLAVELALRTGGEVISADSMQIYKEMDVATAKPTKEEQKGVPHHLLDFLDASKTFSVAQYVDRARVCVQEIHSRGKLPILAGGTGLYVSSLLNHVQFSEEDSHPEVRAELEKRLQAEGGEALLEELRRFDPQSAERLHPNNGKRILRAIEIYRVTGINMTEHLKQSRLTPCPYRMGVIGLDYRNRQTLYDRINRRVDQMVEQGLLEEARRVLSSPHGMTARNAIGYKELVPWVNGESPLEEALEKLKQSTRRYAKRQLTWFRREEWVHWIYVDECSGLEEVLQKSLQYLEHSGVV